MPADAAARDTIALMYHAVGTEAGPGVDPHYAVGAERFVEQIDACLRIGRGAISARDWLAGRDGVIVTFDDGHESNHRTAFPALARVGATADFFVNPAQVGTEGFATWADLREMAAGGMSIQSHGLDHSHYLTALSPTALRSELQRAREEIEANVGKPVRLLAPVGGRCPPRLAEIAGEAGYSHVLDSRPGRIRANGKRTLGRFAVTAGLQLATLESWIRGGRAAVAAEVRYAVLDAAKRLLGDGTYERVRARLLGTGRP
jgi:peptidoglycan/xylan/chitin deacetylase (PgdA/CDA1 family)